MDARLHYITNTLSRAEIVLGSAIKAARPSYKLPRIPLIEFKVAAVVVVVVVVWISRKNRISTSSALKQLFTRTFYVSLYISRVRDGRCVCKCKIGWGCLRSTHERLFIRKLGRASSLRVSFAFFLSLFFCRVSVYTPSGMNYSKTAKE